MKEEHKLLEPITPLTQNSSQSKTNDTTPNQLNPLEPKVLIFFFEFKPKVITKQFKKFKK